MTSVLGWLDQSEDHQRRMREVIDLFAERESRDELGIGVVRDAFADLLFPGLSTVQTRARYFLFVPWIHQHLEARRTSASVIVQRARDWQWRLVQALEKGGEIRGVIGIEAGHGVKRLPASVYWNGLDVLGVRRFRGELSGYYRGIDRFHARHAAREYRGDDPGDDRAEANWHRAMPPPPDDLFESVSFAIEPGEADYLAERFRFADQHSVMTAAFSGVPVNLESETPWEAIDGAGTDPTLANRLHYGRYFSEVIHGAALLYNLLLAEASVKRQFKGEETIDEYRQLLAEWGTSQLESTSVHANVDRAQFWALVRSRSKVPPRTTSFVDRWLDLAEDRALVIADDDEARSLIRDRERTLKKGLARLHNSRALELWNGKAGTSRLTYRWPTGRTMLGDILQGRGHAQP